MTRMVILVLLFGALLGVGAAEARRGTIEITPAPAVGHTSIVSGCGYDDHGELRIYLVWNTDGKHNWDNGGSFSVANDNGCFSFSWTPNEAGLYEILVTQIGQSGKRQPQNKWVGEVGA